MVVSQRDLDLLTAMQDGLPLTLRPYATVGAAIGMGEDEVITRLGAMVETGIIKRLGLVVRHHELGYRANAMVVWDVADDRVDAAGRAIAALDFVTLCYRRPRWLPAWPYNLFCMIHGRDRATVFHQIAAVSRAADLDEAPRAILFSSRRFKQRGATFSPALPEVA